MSIGEARYEVGETVQHRYACADMGVGVVTSTRIVTSSQPESPHALPDYQRITVKTACGGMEGPAWQFEAVIERITLTGLGWLVATERE